MKFIKLGDPHSEYDFFEDTPTVRDEGKPRRTLSYFDIAKKCKSSQKDDKNKRS
ncbi:MAG: hypothetical protein Q4A86_02390 [Clostridia bacterium]|nr:hypothetical protein [Clostridia bacterium]